MSDENRQVAETIYAAFNDRDFERGLALVAENAEWENVASGQVLRGPEGLRTNYEQWARAFPDARCEEIEIRVGEGFALVEFTGRGTNTGLLAGPAGDMAPTGQPVELRFCDVLELRDGKLVRGRSYMDMATMARQLGFGSADAPAV